MKTISLKIDTLIFAETEKLLSQMNKSRNRYINEAIENYNSQQKRMLLAEQLKNESSITKLESLKVLADFENIEDEYSAI